ncbi:MAG: hypothetical protein CM15mV49_730 [uncultured marine virus]|nr:MAG: hypothetical protein CM15mV49_730 [uncultured marine virus]
MRTSFALFHLFPICKKGPRKTHGFSLVQDSLRPINYIKTFFCLFFFLHWESLLTALPFPKPIFYPFYFFLYRNFLLLDLSIFFVASVFFFFSKIFYLLVLPTPFGTDLFLILRFFCLSFFGVFLWGTFRGLSFCVFLFFCFSPFSKTTIFLQCF